MATGIGIGIGLPFQRRRRGVAPAFVPITATGGDEVFDITQNSITYRVHVFEGSDDFVVTDVGTQGKVEALVVGGGGSGGFSSAGVGGGAGGGGAGGLLFGDRIITVGSHNVIVGSGGGSVGTDQTNGNKGNNSEFLDFESEGGGFGANRGGASLPEGVNGGDGGSGGGAGANSLSAVGGNPVAGQGNKGGDIDFNTSALGTQVGAGGGGAGAPGTNVQATTGGGDGGVGLDYSNEFGSSVGDNGWFSGGGGGGHNDGGNINPGQGGQGGGGAAAATGVDGGVNTGGGGGGGGLDGGGDGSGAGGSGITIIRYPLNQPI